MTTMKHNSQTIRLSLVILAALWLLPATAFANAFFIQEMSGDGMAQGGAVVAGGTKPSSMFQNAANLAFIPDLNFELVATTYIPQVLSYTNPQGETTDSTTPAQVVPHAFASFKINDWLAVGIGEFVDFGLAVNWPDDWEGRHIIIDAAMNSFTLNPNVAFGPWHGFAFAVGLDVKWGAVTIKRALTLGLNPYGDDAPNTLELGGQAWGFGANLGVIYQPVDWVRLGMSYRSGIKMAMKGGKADFDVATLYADRFPDQEFDATINLPHLLNWGARFYPVENFSFELDVWLTMWSSYDTLKFTFSEGLKEGPEKTVKVQEEAQNFKDFIQVRLGGEWWFHEHFAMRFGVMLDGNVVPSDTLSPMLPDGHRINSCLGIGTEWSGFYLDLAYMLVYMLPRDMSDNVNNPLPGKYKWVVHDITVGVGYHFDPFFKDQAPAEEEAPIDDPAEAPSIAPVEPVQS